MVDMRCCHVWLLCSGELFDFLVVHGSMKEKEARQKFRQVLTSSSCPCTIWYDDLFCVLEIWWKST